MVTSILRSVRACLGVFPTLSSVLLRMGLLQLFLMLALAATAYAQPTLSKVFTPSTIGPGSVSTITFTITNASAPPVTGLAFTDVLPTVPGDVDIADPSNASTSCELGLSGSLNAPDGGGTITLNDAQIGGNQSCTVTVDVTASTPGVHTNPAITLSSSAGSSMSLPIDLTVDSTLPGFSKSFAPSSVPLGGRSTLTFTIDNALNASRVGNLDFTDNLPVGMVIAGPSNAATDCISATAPNTTITAVPGTSVIALDANGSTLFAGFEVLPTGATCTVRVDVIATGVGMLDNVSDDLLADFVSSGKASDTLDVTATQIALRKSFTDDPVPPGGTVTLEFTIDNFDRNFSATGIAFTDDLTTLVPALAGLTFDSLLSNDCGGSASGVGTTSIGFSGGTLAAGGSCTISVSLSVPIGATPGSYTNTTGAITATIDGSPVVGNMASEIVAISPAPLLTKTFTDDPVSASGTTTLEFTVTNTSPTSGATAIAFSDPFDTVLQTASVTPGNDCCGAGSTCTFTPLFNPAGNTTIPATLTISGASLAPAGMAGDSCTFSITLDVEAGASPGIYANTTTEPTATVDGATRTGKPATDDLIVIGAPSLSKSFIDDPVAPGGTVTLEFTLELSPNSPTDATGITFTDDLAPVLAGLTATGLPLIQACDPDGAGGNPGTGTLSGSAGDTSLTFMGGTLTPGESCTFSVTLDVPMAAASGSYTNTTSGVSATVMGLPATSPAASDDLEVGGMIFTKEFLGDPAFPGQTLTLRFTLENISAVTATGIGFTDSLIPVAGLVATDPALADDCGGTLTIVTTPGAGSTLSYVGGSLAAGMTCNLDVEVTVPMTASDGVFENFVSRVSYTLGATPGFDGPAIDNLTVDTDQLSLFKAFTDDPVAPGDSVTLEFTLTNLNVGQAASSIDFTDDLGAALTNLTFDSVLSNDCGATVSGTGTTMITVSGASLTAGGSCTIRVSLSVPVAAAADIYTNTTSAVTGMIGGFVASGTAASDDLEVAQLLPFSKSFDGPTTATGMATLTFTITNPGANTATGISFSDDLNAVIPGLIATSLPALPCGAGSSLTGVSFLTFTGGELPPMGGMCSFDVDVLVAVTATAGIFPNTTSDLLQNGLKVADPATADLVIEPPPTFAKVFAPDTILAGGISTLTFTIDNTASSEAATSLYFTDNLPAGVVVTTPAVTSNTCGGTLTATAAASVITITGGSVGAESTCTIDVAVTSITSGMHVNTTGDLTSSSGNSGTATDTLTVNPAADLSATKTDGVISATPGQSVTYTIVVSNAGPSADPALTLSDTFPSPPLTCTYTSIAAGGATGNTPAGSGDLAETLSMPSGSSVTYTASCTINSDATGTLSNTASITPSITDTAPGNNSATDSDTALAPEADVLVTKTDNVTAAVPGGMLTYIIVASNAGPSDDPSVTLTDTFPADLTCTFTSAAAGGATGNTAAGSGDLSETLNLPMGSSVAYTATCNIASTATGTLSNTATVMGSVTDPTPGNNSATDSDTVLLGMIVVIKQANPEGATGFDFTTSGTGLSNFSLIDDGTASNTQTFSTLSPGTFEITETVPAGWQLTDLSCVSTSTGSTIVNDPANAKTTITLVAGESVTCTFTDTQEASITVIKDANPEGSTSFAFTATGAGLSDFSLVDDGTAANTQTFMNLLPGSFEITESVPAGWQLANLNCVSNGTGTSAMEDAVNARASISLGAGGNVTCTYTDTQEGSITVIKDANPGSSTSFAFTATGTGLSDFLLVDDGTAANTQTFMNLLPGTFLITETVPTGWTLTDLSCVSNGPGTSASTDVPNAETTITLAATGSVTCTFTDTQNDSITIIKEANPEGATAFDFTASGTGLADFSLMDNGTGSNTQTFSNLLPGTFIITEMIPTGWTLTDLSCVSNGTGTSASTDVPNAATTITLAANGSVTCTFTDTQSPTPIPTLPQWGLLLLTLSLLSLATWQLVGQPTRIGHAGTGAAVLVSVSPDWLSSLLLGQGVAITGLLMYALFSPLVPHDGVGTLLAGLLLGVMIEAYHRSE